MAKKITTRTDKPVQGYGENEVPYNFMVEWLTEGKSEIEKKQIIEEFEESHTYLIICEYGSWSPCLPTLQSAYIAEKENGFIGFVNAILEDYPTFFNH